MDATPLIILFSVGCAGVIALALWLHAWSIDRRGDVPFRAPTQSDYFEPWGKDNERV